MTACKALVALSLTVSVVATGCGADSLDEDSAAMTAKVPVYEYTQTEDGYRLRQVVVKVPERVKGQTPFTSDGMRGVAALLDHRPDSERWHNLWNGDCALGEEVTDVELTPKSVAVQLDGWNGKTCEISQAALDARDQQIAWTTIVNSKGDLRMPPFPEIVVHDGSGVTMDPITADDSYLPSGKEY